MGKSIKVAAEVFLHNRIEKDLQSMERLLEMKEWRSTVITAASIVEGSLAFAIMTVEKEWKAKAFKAGVPFTSVDPLHSNLAKLSGVAIIAKLIRECIRKDILELSQYRANVHVGFSVLKCYEADQDAAEFAVAVVATVLHELGQGHYTPAPAALAVA